MIIGWVELGALVLIPIMIGCLIGKLASRHI